MKLQVDFDTDFLLVKY